MSNYETPLFRDLNMVLISVTIGIVIAFMIVGIIYYIIPAINQYSDFITNNECLWFEEIKQTLCGQEAINHINNPQVKRHT